MAVDFTHNNGVFQTVYIGSGTPGGGYDSEGDTGTSAPTTGWPEGEDEIAGFTLCHKIHDDDYVTLNSWISTQLSGESSNLIDIIQALAGMFNMLYHREDHRLDLNY